MNDSSPIQEKTQQEIVQSEKQQTRQLQKLAKASLLITSTLSLEESLQHITDAARDIVGAHLAIASMTNYEYWTQTISAASFSEKYVQWHDRINMYSGSALASQICQSNQPMRMTQAELEAHPEWQELSGENGKHPVLRGWLAVPLIGRDGRNLGLLQVTDKYEGEFNEDDEAVLVQLAQLGSAAIENARLYAQAQEAINARDELFSIVTHDLKNPVSTMKGFAQLLRRSVDRMDIPDKQQLADGLQRIDKAATRMTALINELLDIAHLQMGKPLELNQRETDVVALAHMAVAEYAQTSKKHSFRINTEVPELVGWWDTTRLERMFGNLLSNAIKYSPQGGTITVELAREEREDGPWAIVRVIDQGMGIPPSDLPHVFDKFRRARNVQGQIKGTGLGLASVRQIVEEHGGTVSVKSKEGEGSTFTIWLPVNLLEEEDLEEDIE